MTWTGGVGIVIVVGPPGQLESTTSKGASFLFTHN